MNIDPSRLWKLHTNSNRNHRMATSPDDIQKAFKGLALAAARVRELADNLGRDGLLKGMPRRQEDAIRQLLLDASRDLERTQQIVRGLGGTK